MKPDNSALHQQPQDTPSSCRLRRTCSEVSIAAYKRIHCNNDYSVLIISGEPSPEELADAFNEIIWELSGLIRNELSDSLHEISRSIGLLQSHIIYVENALKLLRLKYALGKPMDIDVIHELILLGYDGVYDDKGEQGYLQQLNRVESLCKTNVFDLQSMQDEYIRLQKTINGKKQSDNEMDENVMMLSKYMGYRIDTNITMLDEYAQMMNIYIKEANQHKKKETA